MGDFAPTSPYLKIEKTKWVTKTQGVSNRGGSYNFNLYTSACALIVAGSTDERFNHDAHLMYNTLINHYSYEASRVFLLTDLSSYDGITIPRDDDVSQSIVEDACNDIDSLTTSNDDVLVFWVGHGTQTKLFGAIIYCALDCGSSWMTRAELDDALDGITCNRMLVMIGSCYSGYFTQGVMNDENNRAIFSACGVSESSWGFEYSSGSTGHCYWNYAIIRALSTSAASADDDSNNRISVDEFTEFASDYINSIEPIEYEGDDYYQNPMSYIGTSFGSISGVYLGDQYY